MHVYSDDHLQRVWARAGQIQLTRLIQSHDVIAEVGATCGRHHLDSAHVFADLDADLAHLQSQFSGGNDDHSWKSKAPTN